jgi:hypothetical protein
MMATPPTIFRIDNQIMEILSLTGRRVSSIKLFESQNRVRLDLNSIPYVFAGSRRLDSLLIQRIMNGTEDIDTLNYVY